MPSSTYIHADSLYNDLKGAKGSVSWQIGLVVNLLIEEAKELAPGNAALSLIQPLTPDIDEAYVLHMEASDVRAILGQVVTAISPHKELQEVLG